MKNPSREISDQSCDPLVWEIGGCMARSQAARREPIHAPHILARIPTVHLSKRARHLRPSGRVPCVNWRGEEYRRSIRGQAAVDRKPRNSLNSLDSKTLRPSIDRPNLPASPHSRAPTLARDRQRSRPDRDSSGDRPNRPARGREGRARGPHIVHHHDQSGLVRHPPTGLERPGNVHRPEARGHIPLRRPVDPPNQPHQPGVSNRIPNTSGDDPRVVDPAAHASSPRRRHRAHHDGRVPKPGGDHAAADCPAKLPPEIKRE